MCNHDISSRRIDCFLSAKLYDHHGPIANWGRTNPPPPPAPLAKVAKYGKRARVNRPRRFPEVHSPLSLPWISLCFLRRYQYADQVQSSKLMHCCGHSLHVVISASHMLPTITSRQTYRFWMKRRQRRESNPPAQHRARSPKC